MKCLFLRFSIIPLILMLFAVFSCEQKTEKANDGKMAQEDLELDKIPEVVMDALKAKFPIAEIQKWSKETEKDIVLYDIEFKQKDQKFEADIMEDGTIFNWEKEIMINDLPYTVRKAVEDKYANAKIKEIMEIKIPMEKDDLLEGYEMVLETAENQISEVTVAPNGMFLEDSTDE